jgi:hypothetical protein
MLGLMEAAPTWANAQETLNRLAASQSPEQAARTKALSQSFALAQRRVLTSVPSSQAPSR